MIHKIPRHIRNIIGYIVLGTALFFTSVVGRISYVDGMRNRALLTAATTIMEDTDYGICIMGADRKVLIWNNAMERLTGWTFDEVSEGGIDFIMHNGDYIARHRQVFAKAMKGPLTKKTRRIQCTILKKNGTEVKVSITVRVVETPEGIRLAVANMEKLSQVTEVNMLED